MWLPCVGHISQFTGCGPGAVACELTRFVDKNRAAMRPRPLSQSGERAIWGYGVKHRLEAVAFVGAQIKFVLRKQVPDEERDSPDVVLRVVDADGEDGLVPLDESPPAQQRGELGTLDIHLDEGDGVSEKSSSRGMQSTSWPASPVLDVSSPPITNLMVQRSSPTAQSSLWIFCRTFAGSVAI